MGQNSAIEWTDHTFNPWWGCTKVSEACRFCYAETGAARFGTVWGPTARRRFFGDDHWNEPRKWNDAARKAGKPAFVFCASFADVCELLPEDHPDADKMERERDRLFDLIWDTPWLTWLLLTKRPENFHTIFFPGMTNWPPNAWAGTTVETQDDADRRVPHLLATPARKRFLSCEPLLGTVDLNQPFDNWWNAIEGTRPQTFPSLKDYLHWIIVGGESDPHHGSRARPMQPLWVIDLHSQCRRAGIPFFFKQWGDFQVARRDYGCTLTADDLASNQFHVVSVPSALMVLVGKKRSGRIFRGREYNERPAPHLPQVQDANR